MRALLISSAVAGALVLSGCQSTGTGMEYDKAAIGAGLGALLGAGLAYSNADKDKMGQAAAIGAVVGGGAGLLLDKKEKRLREELAGTGVDVDRNKDGSINLVMPSVTFATNSSTIQPRFQTALNDVARVLREDGTANKLALVIHGHTDNTGTDAINNPLSQNRANSVMGYLSSQGIASSRMTARGYGSSSPIASNDTAAGREQNRRVEITVYETK
ncbi:MULTISPECIES: OmpA family protein [unclassified Acinetobacter]|jgi:outer membrane protein OmpA-like peptidoglycan-associated protein|uniref:OmpA family protein n=1 Tax=unclassified Acinetobacter TaxID=196816 RepID=UPI00103D19DD|nr:MULTISPECIES: OmpA family protein [unclassified Acinetobacter]TCB69144.1 OmpA family protein [Acinetobacter sp. ANC 4178]TCB82400.1 OmpA family protein [Acinetobacter sp. ANC 4173]